MLSSLFWLINGKCTVQLNTQFCKVVRQQIRGEVISLIPAACAFLSESYSDRIIKSVYKWLSYRKNKSSIFLWYNHAVSITLRQLRSPVPTLLIYLHPLRLRYIQRLRLKMKDGHCIVLWDMPPCTNLYNEWSGQLRLLIGLIPTCLTPMQGILLGLLQGIAYKRTVGKRLLYRCKLETEQADG